MALELMPDGVTFKKLNKTQATALERYYKRAHDKPLAETVGLPILAGGVVIAGAIGAIAYIFRDEAKTAFEDAKEDFFTWLTALPKKGAIAAGGGLADVIVNLGDALFTGEGLDEPLTKENVLLNPEDSPRDYRYAGPLTRCQRWENDATDWLARDQAGVPWWLIVPHALVLKGIIKNMKADGCSRPTSITVAQWKD